MTDTVREPLRIALYARVSGEEQKQGHNIDSQLSELKQFAAHKNWSITETYIDEAWSGAALARPALDRLRDDAGKSLFDAVLINDVDRLARDVTHLGIIKRDLERSGVSVIFRKIPSENSPTHNLLVNILGSFAEFERELILDRTRRGKRHKVETRQQFIGAIAPYGYLYIPGRNEEHGELKVNPEEAAIVRFIYNWVDAEGLSARRVAERLTDKRLQPRKRGAGWARSSVLRILRSSIYAGTWHYNKHRRQEPASLFQRRAPEARRSSHRLRAKDEWIPVRLPEALQIVSGEQWMRVQQQLDRNRCFSPRNSKHGYLLSGLVRCGGCNAPYVGNPSHGWFQYRCANRCKRLPMVSEEVLNNTVWTALEGALNNPDVLEQAIQDIKQPAVPSDNGSKQVQEALKAIRTEEARILEAYRLGILTADQLARELASIADRRRFLENQRKRTCEEQPRVLVHTSVQDFCKEIQQRLSRLTFETKRAVVRLVLRRIVFEGQSVRIAGIIPLQNTGRIVTTASSRHGRNIDARPLSDAPSGQANSLEVTFEFVRPIVHGRGRRLDRPDECLMLTT
jgi:site-specific DNA recombinase